MASFTLSSNPYETTGKALLTSIVTLATVVDSKVEEDHVKSEDLLIMTQSIGKTWFIGFEKSKSERKDPKEWFAKDVFLSENPYFNDKDDEETVELKDATADAAIAFCNDVVDGLMEAMEAGKLEDDEDGAGIKAFVTIIFSAFEEASCICLKNEEDDDFAALFAAKFAVASAPVTLETTANRLNLCMTPFGLFMEACKGENGISEEEATKKFPYYLNLGLNLAEDPEAEYGMMECAKSCMPILQNFSKSLAEIWMAGVDKYDYYENMRDDPTEWKLDNGKLTEKNSKMFLYGSEILNAAEAFCNKINENFVELAQSLSEEGEVALEKTFTDNEAIKAWGMNIFTKFEEARTEIMDIFFSDEDGGGDSSDDEESSSRPTFAKLFAAKVGGGSSSNPYETAMKALNKSMAPCEAFPPTSLMTNEDGSEMDEQKLYATLLPLMQNLTKSIGETWLAGAMSDDQEGNWFDPEVFAAKNSVFGELPSEITEAADNFCTKIKDNFLQFCEKNMSESEMDAFGSKEAFDKWAYEDASDERLKDMGVNVFKAFEEARDEYYAKLQARIAAEEGNITVLGQKYSMDEYFENADNIVASLFAAILSGKNLRPEQDY